MPVLKAHPSEIYKLLFAFLQIEKLRSITCPYHKARGAKKKKKTSTAKKIRSASFLSLSTQISISRATASPQEKWSSCL